MLRKQSLFTEFVIVVLGVLVALAADAAMDRVRARASAEDALRAILEDVVADSVQLDVHLARIDGRTEARQRLSDFLLTSGELYDSLQFLIDIRQASLYTTFDASTAAFQDLTSSGGLDLVEDSEVRSGVLSYYTQVNDAAALDETSRAAVLDVTSRLIPQVVGGLVWDSELLQNDSLRIREAAAVAFDASEIHRNGALRELLLATTRPFQSQSLTYRRNAESGFELIQLLRSTVGGER